MASMERTSDDMYGLVRHALGMERMENGLKDNVNADEHSIPKDAAKFYQFLKDAKLPLYAGHRRRTKPSFLVLLYHLKCMSGWSNKSFDLLLEELRLIIPKGEKNTPGGELGLDYITRLMFFLVVACFIGKKTSTKRFAVHAINPSG